MLYGKSYLEVNMLSKDINRRDFLGGVGFASMGMMAALGMGVQRADGGEKVIPGVDDKGRGNLDFWSFEIASLRSQ